jgi:hypothetical protein
MVARVKTICALIGHLLDDLAALQEMMTDAALQNVTRIVGCLVSESISIQ